MEITGKEDLTGSGLTLSKSGGRKIYTSPNQNSPRSKQMETCDSVILPMDHDDDDDRRKGLLHGKSVIFAR